MKLSDKIVYQLTLTDREILPEEPSIIGIIRLQFKQAFKKLTRDRRNPEATKRRLKISLEPRRIILGIEPTYNKVKGVANFFSNAVGKGDVL